MQIVCIFILLHSVYDNSSRSFSLSRSLSHSPHFFFFFFCSLLFVVTYTSFLDKCKTKDVKERQEQNAEDDDDLRRFYYLVRHLITLNIETFATCRSMGRTNPEEIWKYRKEKETTAQNGNVRILFFRKYPPFSNFHLQSSSFVFRRTTSIVNVRPLLIAIQSMTTRSE